MKHLLMVIALTVTACGGGSDCPDTYTRTKVTDSTGTYWLRCVEFQCPGYVTERRCWRE